MKNSLLKRFVVLLCIITSFGTHQVYAEGTRTVSPNSNEITALTVIPYRNSGSYLNCPEDNRVYFRINNHNVENFYFGFSWREYFNTLNGIPPYKTNVFYRIRRPNGTVAVGPTLWNPSSSTGRIDTYAQAFAGPNVGGLNPSGYTPLTFDPTENGEFWIEIYCSNDGGATIAPGSGNDSSNWTISPFFDLTVASATNTVYNGRVHSDKWAFTAVDSEFKASFQATSSPNFFAYTTDQVVVRINFQNGFQPVAYDLSVNSYGVVNGGNFAQNRRSINSNVSPSLLNGYKIFLNQPDSIVYPVSPVPQLPRFIEPAITGCGPTNYKVRFDLPESGDVKLLLNINGIPGFQAGTTDVILEGFGLPAGFNELTWNGLDGLGASVPNTTNIQLSIILLKGRYNLPIYDAEVNKNGINISLIAPISVANAQMFWDDSLLTPIGNNCNNGLSNSNNITGAGLNNSLIGQLSPGHAWNGDGNLSNVYPAPVVNGNDANDILCDDFGNLRVLNTWGWGAFSQEVFTNAKKGCADLFVDINSSNTNPNVSSQVTFTITAGNNGIINATNVEVAALLPDGFSLVSATPTSGSYNSSTGVWAIPTIANGQTFTLTIVANVLPEGDYNYPVTIEGFEFDPNLVNNEDFIRTEPIPVSDLQINKTVDNSNPQVGSTVIFTINGVNNGPSNATGVFINDLLPSGYTYVSHIASHGSYNPSNGVWSVGDAFVGSPGTLQITALVNPSGNYTNTASAQGNEFDPILGNNTSSVTPTVAPVSDLAIVKTMNNPNPLVGTNIVFTISVTNNGPSNEPNVTVTDLLPSGYTYVSHTPSVGTYDFTTGIWSFTNLAVGVTRTLTITALVNTSGFYTNTATVSGSNTDINLINNTASASPIPVNNADLSITKTVDNATPDVGSSVIFTVTLTNNGPNQATNIVVNEAVPNGYTITDVGLSLGQYTWGADWSNITLDANQSTTLTITATVNPSGNYNNVATITSSSVLDPVTTNNTANATTAPRAVSDVSVTKTVDNPTPNVGENVVFTLFAYNAGPSNATGVIVNDLLPAGYTYISHTATGGSYNPTTGEWNIGNFPAINNRNLFITAVVNQNGDHVNTATINANEFDNDNSNNTGTASTTPVNRNDISVLKTVSNVSPFVGSNITFTIDVVNNGPSNANNLQIEDILPTGYTFVSSSTSNGFYNSSTGIWNIGNLSNGGTASLDINVTVNPSGNYTNTASTTNLTFIDPDNSNNTSSVSTTPIPVVDIIVNKSVSNPNPLVGEQVTFTVTVSNNGPSDATNITIAEALPNGYTQGSFTVTNGTWNFEIWNIPSLPSGQSATLTINATVRTSGDYCNVASAFTSEIDTDSSNNSSTACTVPTPNADLSITKVVDVATPNVGNIINFTITVTNNGPNNTSGVIVNDLLPAGYNFLSSTPSVGTYNNVTGIWNVGNLNNGASANLVLTVSVASNGPYINTATTTSDLIDPNFNNNTAVSSPVVGQVADLAVVKTINNSTTQVGATVNFTLTATNFGSSNATGVTVLDLLPTGYTYISHSTVSGTYNPSNGRWAIGNLNNTASAILTITATVNNSGNYTNTASIFGNQSDNNTANNTSSVRPTVTRIADLVVSKTVSNSTPNVGANVLFTVSVINNGPSNATGVIVNDLIPSGYEIISFNSTAGVYNSGNGNWVLNNLNNGSSAQLFITVKVLGSGNYTNTANATSNLSDPNTSNNTASASTTPVSSADLSVNINVDILTPMVDTNVIFTIVATNNGLSNASGVTVTNVLPDGYTFVSANPSIGAYDSSTGVWTIGNLIDGESEVLEVTATVLASGIYVNEVSIIGNEVDSDLTNNNDSEEINPLPSTDVAVSKTVTNLTPNVGEQVIFTIQVINNGPSAATGVIVTDVLQSGYTFVSSNATTSSYNQTLGTWLIGNLANGQSETLTITATVNTSGNYINRANVKQNEYDSNFSNNNSSVLTRPIQNSDVAITKVVNNATPNVGDNVIFTLTASNNGPNIATNVIVNDLLPSGYEYVSHTLTQGTYNFVSGAWSIGNLNTTPRQLNITAKVLTSGNYTNVASISSSFVDTNLSNNTATAATNPISTIDLGITYEVDILAPDVSSQVTLTINIINNGPSNATGVLVNNLLPSGYTFVSATPSTGSYNQSTGEWSVGNLAINQTQFLEIIAVVNATGTFLSEAVVSGNENEVILSNNSATILTTPSPLSDIGVTKTVDNTTPFVGDVVVFTITASNFGPSDATSVVVTDLLPSGYTYVSHTASLGTYDQTTGIWDIGSIDFADNVVLTINALVNISGNYTNTAIIDGAENDTNTSNTKAQATTIPVQKADLSVVKSVNDLTPSFGGQVEFTIVATNNGISQATGVRVQDLLPSGYTFVSYSATVGSYNTVSGVWNIGTMSNGQTQTLVITALVNLSGNYTNIAEISGNEFDENLSNNSSNVTTIPADLLELVDDLIGSINGFEGANDVLNVLENDIFNGNPADLTLLTLTELNNDSNGLITLDPNGNIDVNPLTPAGNYTIEYQLCSINNPLYCETALAVIEVVPPIIDANEDDYTSTPVNATTGFTNIFGILSNDVYNTDFINPNANLVTITLLTSTPYFTINPNGTLNVALNTPAGNYILEYQICDVLNPTNCDITRIILVVENTSLELNVLLQGALFGTTDGKMRDDLRFNNVIPLTEPYTDLGLNGNTRFLRPDFISNETTSNTVLGISGDDAIVDWVFIELRDPADSNIVLKTKSALVQRDGDIVDSNDGASPVRFSGLDKSSYYIAVKHRNHLGTMTANPIDFTSGTVSFDFSSTNPADLWHKPDVTFNYDGFEQVLDVSGKYALWAGNSNSDRQVKYTGPQNDQASPFGTAVNFVDNINNAYNFNDALPLYNNGDINMDAKVKYRGLGNDTTFIFFNIITKYTLNSVPLYNFNPFIEQIPNN